MSDQDRQEVYHRIETGQVLGTPDPIIEVYGDGPNGWYEWRIMREGKIEHDTLERGYGDPDIALRDALCYVYGPPDELGQLDQAIARARRGDPQPR